MNNLSRKFEKKQEFACSAVVRLKEQVVPIDRDIRYGEPLGKVLRRKKLGDLVGAGTTLCAREEPAEKDIEYAELHLDLANLDSALNLVIDELIRLGAPVGSDIICFDSTFMAGLEKAFSNGADGKVYGPCAWPSEILLYFAGDSADAMYSIVEKVPSAFPIFQNARVVFQRRDSSKEPKSLRLAFVE